MKLWYKLRALFRKKRLDAEMSEEMRVHLDLQAERNRAAGMNADEARYAARREFGGIEQIKERARDRRGWGWLDRLSQDLTYAARALRKSPSFTLTAVLTLAFGIGVNAALFTVYNAVALNSLPIKNPDEVVSFLNRAGLGPDKFSYPDYLDYRADNHVLSGLAAWAERRVELSDDADAPPAAMSGVGKIHLVSENYLSLLGARLARGRGFLPEDNRPGATPVIVLSHAFWERRLQSDPAAIGQTLALNGQRHVIIGVAAPDFVGQPPMPPLGWVPMLTHPEGLDDREARRVLLIGRLLPGVAESKATADLQVIASRLDRAHPSTAPRVSIRLGHGMKFIPIPLSPMTVAAMSPVLLGFAMVLVIACTNVANLLLARSVTRQQEIGVRLTLGASRGRIVRLLLTENALLGLLATAVGLPLAWWTLQVARALIVGALPVELQASFAQLAGLLDFSIDARVIGFTLAVAFVAVVAAGFAPALHASRGDLVSTLKNEGSAFGRGVRQSRLRHFLVIVQVAVCLTLLSCTGVLVGNMIKLRSLDLGCDPAKAFTIEFTGARGGGRFSTDLRQSLDTLRSLPDVAAACTFQGSPLFGPLVAGVESPSNVGGERDYPCALVSSGFFETLGIALQRGRAFGARDIDAHAAVVVVSETAALRLWPGQNPLGQTLAIRGQVVNPRTGTAGRRAVDETREYEVIGVARDVRRQRLDAEEAFLYLPLPPDTPMLSAICVRPRADGAQLTAIVAQAAAAGVPLQAGDSLARFVALDSLPFRALGWLSGGLGGLALLMATVGLYGVMAFAVSQRVREIGIRVALGATASKIAGLFLRQGARLVGWGVAIGAGGGGLFALVLRRMLPGAGESFDLLMLACAALMLSAVALLACWLPARRAAKVDPMVALRCE